MLNNKNLQLYRNDVYFNDKETAKLALESQLKISSDGELVISRYAVKDENDTVVDVKTLFGFAANGADGVFATICDYEDFLADSKLKELKVNDVLANWDETNTSLSLVINASDIDTPSGYTTISYSALGDTTFESIEADEPIDSALSKIESNINKLIQVTDKNELVTAHALTKLNNSSGFDVNGEYIADKNDVLLSGATSLKSADTLLSSAVSEIESNINTLTQNVIENEFVTAHSLTKLNESSGFHNGEYIVDENDAYLSGATSLQDADTLLSEAIDSVGHELQSQADRITQLENNPSVIGSETITIEDAVDESGNVIGKKVSIAESIDIYCDEY